MSDRGAPRHRSRQVALQVLYAADLAARSPQSAVPIGDVFEGVADNFELPEGARAFAKELVSGVSERRAELDELLALHATHWRVSRMAAVDRNILRLGAYELTRTDTPASVVLDEAVELARRFGAEQSHAFVNGVLDALARAARAPGAGGKAGSPEGGA